MEVQFSVGLVYRNVSVVAPPDVALVQLKTSDSNWKCPASTVQGRFALGGRSVQKSRSSASGVAGLAACSSTYPARWLRRLARSAPRAGPPRRRQARSAPRCESQLSSSSRPRCARTTQWTPPVNGARETVAAWLGVFSGRASVCDTDYLLHLLDTGSTDGRSLVPSRLDGLMTQIRCSRASRTRPAHDLGPGFVRFHALLFI
jgi:hypothetical protein